jgi:hypothetical protein
MSVDDRRFAAAQRTAASRHGGDYARAARQLPSTGAIVLVSASTKPHETPLDRLTSSYTNRELCSVTAEQLKRVAAHYQVGQMTITVDGKPVVIATISGQGANDHELREYLGDPNMKCKLVREGGVFFLPFDPHTS